MGVVWRAIDVRLERSVAVKQILAQPGLSEAERDNMRQRAMREAKNAARLQHPNAIVVFDIAEHGGDPCLVMEYLPGRSLSALLGEEQTLPLSQVARIGEQVASALVAAHRAGIVHRDVKPGNILLDDHGTVKITDFGISRAAGDMALTQTGLIGGTPAYLAPELARGSDPVPSSDVFALGATLYQALEGETPYGNSSNQLALLYAAANGNINPPKQSGAATALLMHLLRTNPEERPTMAEARDRLAALAAQEPTPPGTEVSPALFSTGNGAGRQPVTPLAEPAGIRTPGGSRPPWQRVEPAAVQQAPAAPPMTPPRPVNPPPTAAYMPTQARPPAQQQPRSGPIPIQQRPAAPRRPAAAPRSPNSGNRPPDSKRKMALYASIGAGVVVVAVVVFLILSSGTDNKKTSTGSSPSGSQSNSSQQSSSGAQTPSSPAASALGQTPNTGGSVGYTPAGNFVLKYFGEKGSDLAWTMLTPAAQEVFGNQTAFAQYWSQFQKDIPAKTARADKGLNADGSVDMYVDMGSLGRRSFRVVSTADGLKIDANTKVDGLPTS
ncbi:MAG: serine/threonine protein kinase [Amycolatopsis sp.]|jgi:serine/threonine protein kinase|nr:serine/threonine protein kinase [Amycolatopsis sp.]